MIRALIYFVEVAVVVAIAVWIADRPGTVSVDWQGWRIETSVGVLVLAVFALVVVAAGLYALWRWLLRRPDVWSMRRRLKRQENGLLALSDGLVAIAAGEPGEARKHTRRARCLLDHAPLTLLLSAQTAQIEGNEDAARQAFETMLESPETEFLGLRGLILQALREDDHERALALARRAYALKPQTPWVLDTMIALQSRAGNWREAQRLVEEAQRSRRRHESAGRRQQAALLTERARAAQAAGQAEDAVSRARRANELDPALAPAAVLRARLVGADGRKRRARKVLERAWQDAPHPDIVAAYVELTAGKGSDGDASPLERYKAVETLARPNRDHRESRLALAAAALDAKLWGEARAQISALEAAGPTAQVFRLRARLAEEDPEDGDDPGMWLDRAAAADADHAWVCGECGTVADEWSAVCGQCGAFASLAWSQPPRVHRTVLDPPGATAHADAAVTAPERPDAG